MSERTFSREAFLHSQQLWKDGEFGPEWLIWRQRAADRGFIFPPSGSKHDSVEDDEPSQRALIYRAIDETPELLRRAISLSRSWSNVLAVLLQGRDGMREDADFRDKDVVWNRRDELQPRQALERLDHIFAKIRDSAA
jgi:hypothetical protein